MELSSYRGKKLKILLVEDDEIARTAMKVLVENVFYCDLDAVEAGFDALRLIDKNFYNLILVDLGLLESDGFRITQTVRNRVDEKRNVLIIGVTAYLNDSVRKCGLKIGMNEVLGKPLTLDDCKRINEKYFSE